MRASESMKCIQRVTSADISKMRSAHSVECRAERGRTMNEN
jgi:hypothetical protein